MLNELAILIGLVSPDLTGGVAVSAAYALHTTTVDERKCCGACRNGVITHGDGHKTKCPCPDDCKCKAVAHPPVILKCENGTCTSKR